MANPRLKPKAVNNWPCLRARLSCKIGRDALNARDYELPEGVTPMEWAMYNVLQALEDLAMAIEDLGIERGRG